MSNKSSGILNTWDWKPQSTPTCHLQPAPALGTFPDIAHAVQVVNRYRGNPMKVQWGAVKRLFRYLRRTAHSVLAYEGDLQALKGYTIPTGPVTMPRGVRRLGTYVFNKEGGALSWSSKPQITMALSTCEAQAAKEAIWLGNLPSQMSLGKPRTL